MKNLKMTRLRKAIADDIQSALKECSDAIDNECPHTRWHCPFKVKYDKGDYACELAMLDELLGYAV